MTPIGDRDARVGERADRRAHARHDLERDARRGAGARLLAAAAEHVRVAALETHDGAALAREPTSSALISSCVRGGSVVAALADVDALARPAARASSSAAPRARRRRRRRRARSASRAAHGDQIGSARARRRRGSRGRRSLTRRPPRAARARIAAPPLASTVLGGALRRAPGGVRDARPSLAARDRRAPVGARARAPRSAECARPRAARRSAPSGTLQSPPSARQAGALGRDARRASRRRRARASSRASGSPRARLERERALPHRGQQPRRDRCARAIRSASAEPLEARAGEHDRVERLASSSLREPRVGTLPRSGTISRSGAQREQLRGAPHAAGADARAARQVASVAPRARATSASRGSARSGNAASASPARSRRGQILRAVHGEVGAAVEQRLLDLLHEQALAADLRERHVASAVAARRERHAAPSRGRARARARRARGAPAHSASSLAARRDAHARHREASGSSSDVAVARASSPASSSANSSARRLEVREPLLALGLLAQARERRVQQLVHDRARQRLDRVARRSSSAEPRQRRARPRRADRLDARAQMRGSSAPPRSAANQPSKRCCSACTIASARADLAPALLGVGLGRSRREVVEVVEVDVVELRRPRDRRCAARRCRSRTAGGAPRSRSARSRRARVSSGASPPIEVSTTSASAQQRGQLVEAVRGRAEAAPRARAARAGVRFATRTAPSPRSRSALERELDHLARADQQRASCPRGVSKICAREVRPPRAPPRPAAPRCRVSVRTRFAVAKACWKRRAEDRAAGAALDGGAVGVLHLAEDLRLADHHRVERATRRAARGASRRRPDSS